MQYLFCLFLILVWPFVQFCSLLTKLYDIFRGNSHLPYSLTKYFTFTIVWNSTCLVSFPGLVSFCFFRFLTSANRTFRLDSPPIMQCFIRLVACVGSGDPVRVLRLYTMITLDEVCSIYCWDICTTCRYWSTCYSTCASGPTALRVCSRLCLATDWLVWVDCRTVLYDAFYSYLCRRYWKSIFGLSKDIPTGVEVCVMGDPGHV